jgi:hypothetical protein
VGFDNLAKRVLLRAAVSCLLVLFLPLLASAGYVYHTVVPTSHATFLTWEEAFTSYADGHYGQPTVKSYSDDKVYFPDLGASVSSFALGPAPDPTPKELDVTLKTRIVDTTGNGIGNVSINEAGTYNILSTSSSASSVVSVGLAVATVDVWTSTGETFKLQIGTGAMTFDNNGVFSLSNSAGHIFGNWNGLLSYDVAAESVAYAAAHSISNIGNVSQVEISLTNMLTAFSDGAVTIASIAKTDLTLDVDPAPAPEPGTLVLLFSSAVMLGGYAWRRRRTSRLDTAA